MDRKVLRRPALLRCSVCGVTAAFSARAHHQSRGTYSVIGCRAWRERDLRLEVVTRQSILTSVCGVSRSRRGRRHRIATQLAEPSWGGMCCAVHPDDARYRGLVGQFCPWCMSIGAWPVIATGRIDPNSGRALKFDARHAPLDYELSGSTTLARRDPRSARGMTPDTGKYAGMERFARADALAEGLADAQGCTERVRTLPRDVGHCDAAPRH